MVKVFLVDDEVLTIMELKYILEKIHGVEVCGSAMSGKEAIKQILALEPDVVFLDIELNDIDGIEIAEILKKMQRMDIKIIFVTAYEEFAVRAFELNAVDYVLKPFSEERIKDTINRILNKISLKNKNEIIQKVTVNINGKLIVIDFEQIIFIEAQGRNSIIFVSDQSYNTGCSLKEIEARLNNAVFFKSHRSYIVNLNKISEIIPWFNGTYQIKMKHYPDIKIPVSRQNVKKLKSLIGF